MTRKGGGHNLGCSERGGSSCPGGGLIEDTGWTCSCQCHKGGRNSGSGPSSEGAGSSPRKPPATVAADPAVRTWEASPTGPSLRKVYREDQIVDMTKDELAQKLADERLFHQSAIRLANERLTRAENAEAEPASESLQLLEVQARAERAEADASNLRLELKGYMELIVPDLRTRVKDLERVYAENTVIKRLERAQARVKELEGRIESLHAEANAREISISNLKALAVHDVKKSASTNTKHDCGCNGDGCGCCGEDEE